MRDVQTWRRLVLLAILKTTGPQTAADLAERFQALADAEGWPVQSARGVDSATVSGVLRKLLGDGLVVQHEVRAQDKRAGRTAPNWCVAPLAVVDETYPPPPDADVPRGNSVSRSEKPTTPTADEVMSAGFDELAGIIARHQGEIARFVERFRANLNAAHE